MSQRSPRMYLGPQRTVHWRLQQTLACLRGNHHRLETQKVDMSGDQDLRLTTSCLTCYPRCWTCLGGYLRPQSGRWRGGWQSWGGQLGQGGHKDWRLQED